MNRKFYIIIMAMLMIATSCSDFVDEPAPTAEVDPEAIFASEAGIRSFFTGTYRRIRFINNGIGDDSEGLGSLVNTRNVKGNDCIRPQFDWFVFEYRYQDRVQANLRKPNAIWNSMYEIINSMNVMIDRVGNAPISEASKTLFIAEARAIRGMSYFDLIREFAKPFAMDPSSPGVPIYLEPTTLNSEGRARSSVGDVYQVIREDLEFASQNLTANRNVKSDINKNVADGLLARVYLDMEEYGLAATAANSARQGLTLNAAGYSDGFGDLQSAEWMWGLPQQNDQTLFFGSFASVWDGTRYSPIFINPNLTSTFSATDVRALFFADAGTGLPRTNKFVAAPDFGEDVVLMRVAEMFLIEAEGLARQGQDANASTVLFELQSDRDPNATASGATGQALIDEIMLERRKEMYGEGGPDYIDARRLQLPLTRDENHPTALRFALEANDKRFIYPIPQAELDANPNINDEDQNEL